MPPDSQPGTLPSSGRALEDFGQDGTASTVPAGSLHRAFHDTHVAANGLRKPWSGDATGEWVSLAAPLSPDPSGDSDTAGGGGGVAATSAAWVGSGEAGFGPLRSDRKAPVKLCGAASENQRGKTPSILFDCKVGACEARGGALLDSGAEQNFISAKLVHEHGLDTRLVDTPFSVELADGRVAECNRVVTCMLRLDGWTQPAVPLHVVPLGSSYDVILGMPWLARFNPQIDLKEVDCGNN